MADKMLTPIELNALELLWMRKGHGHTGDDERSRQAWHKILQRAVEWAHGQPMKGFEAGSLDELEGLLRKTVFAPWVTPVFAEIRATLGALKVE